MQGLWSRAAPAPQSSCRCVSCLSTASNGVASRGTSAASKRRLRIGNSVTALYTSIFAAAALADAQAKGQRRIEWEEKIAAVKEEVNELVDEEKRLLEALSRRKTKFLNGALQTRQFGTATRPTYLRYQWARRGAPFSSFHSTTAFDQSRDNQIVYDLLAEAEDSGLESIEERCQDEQEEVGEYGISLRYDEDAPEWLSRDLIHQKVIRKLALKQLAIRLLLRPTIAHSYLGVERQYGPDHETPQLNVPDLLQELHYTRSRMNYVMNSKNPNIDDLATDLTLRTTSYLAQERTRLDFEVQRDTRLFAKDGMSLQELLLRLSNSLMESTDPDRPELLRMMILTFTKSHQNDLCELILKTVLPHKFPLAPTLVLAILNFFRKSKNLRGFDSFLNLLTGRGYPVDLGYMSPYSVRVVNGIEIVVPPVDSANPVIYSTLIAACLRFNQPERADAYLVAARSTGFMDDFASISAYLRFYAIRKDWQKGIQTLKRALAFIGSSTEHLEFRAERVIVLMVQLCDKCEKYDMSEAIITSAVNSGFDWEAASRQLDIKLAYDPDGFRWKSAGKSVASDSQPKLPSEKYHAFVSALSEHIDEVEGKITRPVWQDMMERHSQDILAAVLAGSTSSSSIPAPADMPQSMLEEIRRQADLNRAQNESAASELTSLRQEISQLKQTRSTAAADRRREITSLATDVRQNVLSEIRRQAEITEAHNESAISAHTRELISMRQEIYKLHQAGSGESHRQELSTLRDEISQLKQNRPLATAAASTEEITSLQIEISKLKRSSSDAAATRQEEINTLLDQIAQLKQKESAAAAQKQEIKSLQAEIAKLKRAGSAAEAQKQEMKSLRAEVSQLKRNNSAAEAHKTEMKSLWAEILHLKQLAFDPQMAAEPLPTATTKTPSLSPSPAPPTTTAPKRTPPYSKYNHKSASRFENTPAQEKLQIRFIDSSSSAPDMPPGDGY
ncbi:hypothetical protein BO70DRAFT_361289 [Aspergillus heteromorphus CBS 117.55]|uniref:Uncharacterized protein n=1 Tax=Aspergillus heteromorphus CBS 117.55 TaxID=1448321 RepID=A0A317WIB0_9EURO|nr:uncharacterized protein BO70DRAFT_361289 [Aspergillus heteromorphus CBS 117.55]PWY84907.1 hypothetical protein BO70DRAFT_361289 [Aspergillus heteromorphus CBS 117.55]